MSGVLCSGSIIYDTLVRPVENPQWGTTTFVDAIEYHVGGNGANTSLALATLGTPVRLVGTVGRDTQGQFVLDALRKAGVDTRAVAQADAPTAATIALVNGAGGRKFLHRLGASACAFSKTIEFAPGLVEGMRHYHMASLFILPRLREHAAETLANARAAGLSTSLDTNWDPEGRWLDDLAPCLPQLDILFVNEDEARMLTGSSRPKTAAERLLEGGARAVVIKLGGRGCAIYRGSEEILCPGFPVEVVDTTGAGDCFVAGFLDARLRSASLLSAATFANAAGALSVGRVGAVTGIRCREEIELWMRGFESK